MAASDVSEGPVLSVINKRLRALRKKYNRIVQMEESVSKGKTLNKEQEETLRSKPAVIAGIDELEKLREPLASAIAEEINLATSASATPDNNPKNEGEGEGVMCVEDLLNLLYFGCMFDVKSLQSEFSTATMLTRTHERACCLSYDCMPEDESSDVIDLLGENDLDLISMLSGLLIYRPVNSPLSHKRALRQCIEHAKLWLTKSDQPIVPDSDVTYTGLRSKLNRIISSLYFTTDPVKVEATAANYEPYSVPVEESVGVVTANESVQVHTIAIQSQHKEEECLSSQGNDTNGIQASSVEVQQGENLSELPAEVEEVTPEAEGDDNLKDMNFKEQQSVPRRSYQNQNYRGHRNGDGGGRRGYSNGRGGRGRGGSYQNGRNQYYDQSGNYYQKSHNNNYRGRGGRGGNYNPHASGGQAGNFSVDA
nr:ATP-dependent RNA helicase A protein-like isoform X2 [Nicotiana tomentosiformis]